MRIRTLTLSSLLLAILLFTQLIAPLAFASSPTRSLPARQIAVQAALGWLRESGLNKEFGIASCDVTRVVALVGEDPDGPAWTLNDISLLDNCETIVPTYLASRDTGRMAKVLRAVIAAGADPYDFGGLDLIAEIEANYDPDIGLYDYRWFFRQNLAILALVEAGRSIPDEVLPAVLAQQHPDGSWGWAVEPDPESGFATVGDLDTTARTLQVLQALGLPSEHQAFHNGLNFITSRQIEDGGWGDGDGPTNSNSTALAIDGLVAGGADPESPAYALSGDNPVQVLLHLQEGSGAFIYRPGAEESRLMATLDAVPALMHPYPGDIRFYLPLMIYH